MARSRSITASLSRLLGAVQSPVYVLDEQRTLVYVNAACERWLDVRGEQIVGRRCDYHSAPSTDRLSELTGSLCPPPEAFAGKVATAWLRRAGGAEGAPGRRARFLPMGTGELDMEGVICVVDAEESPPPAESDNADADHDLHAQLQQFHRELAGRYRLDRLVGQSLPIRRVRRQALLAVNTQSPTVIVGPPGSGREHIARTIHYAGDADNAPPLMPLACPLLDAELLQTTIVAFARRCADLESPRKGALLLVDVDQLGVAAQAELAGFLNIADFDLHLLATAERSLLELSEEDKFRRDLAYALSTLVIQLPPLSARTDDIPVLAQMFLEQLNAAGGGQVGGFSPQAMELICGYDWPGNVDELADVVRRAHAAAHAQVTADDLPKVLHHADAAMAVPPPRDEQPIVLDQLLADIERELIERAMRRAGGNKTKAAELLGITRARLHRKLDDAKAND